MLYLNHKLSTNFSHLEDAVDVLFIKLRAEYLLQVERIYLEQKAKKEREFAEIERKHYVGVKKFFK